jgi:4-amino-4-deoxy-L-arabinose transferase-like glycosyltransferase
MAAVTETSSRRIGDATTRAARKPRATLLRGEAARTVAVCVVVAFAARLLLVVSVESVLSPDGVNYAQLARAFAAGNFRAGMSVYFPPLYSALVALSSHVFRDVEFAGRFVSIVAGAALCLPSYLLTRAWYGRREALIACVVVALHPLLVYYSSVLLTEATYTLLFTCGVLAGWRALVGGGARAHFSTGAIFGACYLLKPEAAGFVVLLVALRVAANFYGARRRATTTTHGRAAQTARDCAALACGFLIFALPYVIYLHQQLGAWTISGKLAGHLWQGGGRAGEFKSTSLVPNFASALVQTAKGLRGEYELLALIFSPPFVALAALGLFRAAWSRKRLLREMYLAAFVAATLAGYAVTLPNIRFLVPLLPILICWLARGVVEIEDWTTATLARAREDENGANENLTTRVAPLRESSTHASSSRVARFAIALVVIALLVSLVPLFVYLLRGEKWGDYHGQKVAAAWIKEHAPRAAPRVMASAPVAAFYAGGEYVAFADAEIGSEDYDALISRARRERADFIVANERSLKNTPLRSLLDSRAEHPGLRLVHEFEETPGHRMLVYVLAGDG